MIFFCVYGFWEKTQPQKRAYIRLSSACRYISEVRKCGKHLIRTFRSAAIGYLCFFDCFKFFFLDWTVSLWHAFAQVQSNPVTGYIKPFLRYLFLCYLIIFVVTGHLYIIFNKCCILIYK